MKKETETDKYLQSFRDVFTKVISLAVAREVIVELYNKSSKEEKEELLRKMPIKELKALNLSFLIEEKRKLKHKVYKK